MDQLDEESAQIREVYSRYGLAMYLVQCLERQLAIVLATEYGPGPHKITRVQYDDLLSSLFEQTMGGLLTRLRRSASFPVDFDAQLREALKTRNWLAHHYFWDRAGQFMTQDGRERMIRELEQLRATLDSLDGYFTKVTDVWAQRHGLTREMIEQHMKRMVDKG